MVGSKTHPRAIQDDYPTDYSHCYGCGRLNEHGLQIKSYWEGEEAVCTYTPEPHHLGIPGYVYGGLIASLIDCHSIGTAAAAYDAHADAPPHGDVRTRFVTAALHVDYLRPTPLGVPLEVRAHATEIKGRKVTVAATLSAEGKVCARGEVVAVRIPEQMRIRNWDVDRRSDGESGTQGAATEPPKGVDHDQGD